MLGIGLAGGGRRQGAAESGVEANGQVGSLLLGAAQRHHRYRAVSANAAISW